MLHIQHAVPCMHSGSTCSRHKFSLFCSFSSLVCSLTFSSASELPLHWLSSCRSPITLRRFHVDDTSKHVWWLNISVHVVSIPQGVQCHVHDSNFSLVIDWEFSYVYSMTYSYIIIIIVVSPHIVYDKGPFMRIYMYIPHYYLYISSWKPQIAINCSY